MAWGGVACGVVGVKILKIGALEGSDSETGDKKKGTKSDKQKQKEKKRNTRTHTFAHKF